VIGKLRRCPQCRVTYEANATNFYKNKAVKGGLTCYCKLCQKKDKHRSKAVKKKKKIAKKRAQVTKRCLDCRKTFYRTSEFFYRHKDKLDGLQSRCKECDKKKATKWREDNKVQFARHQHKHGKLLSSIQIRTLVRDRLRAMRDGNNLNYSKLLEQLMDFYERNKQ